MKINNILENELLKTIEYYYPQDIVETSDLVYINSEETKRRNKAYFENKDILTWENFVNDNVDLDSYSGMDYSFYKEYNFCYRFTISYFNQICYLFSSALTPAYCFVNFLKNGNQYTWNTLNEFNSPLNKSYQKHFPLRFFIPESILKQRVKNFYVQPYSTLGEGRIYDYIFAKYNQPYEVFENV